MGTIMQCPPPPSIIQMNKPPVVIFTNLNQSPSLLSIRSMYKCTSEKMCKISHLDTLNSSLIFHFQSLIACSILHEIKCLKWERPRS